MKNRKLKLAVGLVLLFAFFLLLTYLPFENDHSITPESQTDSSALFITPTIQANAAYVLDLSSDKIIFAKNSDVPLPLASLTKLMTVLVARRLLSPDEIITVSASSLATEGDSGLLPNEHWTLKNLSDFSLFVSSNDGVNAIALAAASKTGSGQVDTSTTTLQKIFAAEMNSTARELGFNSFLFENESGLDIQDTIPGGVGSAADVSRLMEYLLKNYPDLIEITKNNTFTFTSGDGIKHTVSNTDQAITKVSYITASKTGFTTLAGGNLSVIYNIGLNYPVVITVLGSTIEDRFNDVIALASSTSAYILGE